MNSKNNVNFIINLRKGLIICSLFIITTLSISSCFGMTSKTEEVLKKKFLSDTKTFEYVPTEVSSSWNQIINKYNKLNNTSIQNISMIPRDFLYKEYKERFYDKNKMICSTQSLIYSKILDNFSIKNFVIHILLYNHTDQRPYCFHDNLIYEKNGVWNIIDFTSAMNDKNYKTDDFLIKEYFDKPLESLIKERSFSTSIDLKNPTFWEAIGCYKDNDIVCTDLGEVIPSFETVLKEFGYNTFKSEIETSKGIKLVQVKISKKI